MHRLIFLVALTAAAQDQGGQSVFRNVFVNLTAPRASPAIRNIGQTNHVMVVKAHTGTAQLGGLICRIEASTDNASWFPITVDLAYLPALGTPPMAYALVKGNGVYPYIRVSCPSVPATPGLDVSYIGSQYPYGDIILTADRFLTTSVGGSIANLAPPPEPTSTDGILTAGPWTTICTNDPAGYCGLVTYVDNLAGTITSTQTSSVDPRFGGDSFLGAPPIPVQNIPGGMAGWNKVTIKMNPYNNPLLLGDGATFKGLVLRDSVTGYMVNFAYKRTRKTDGSGWIFHVGNAKSNRFYDDGYKATLLETLSTGTVEKTACLAVSKSGSDLTFSYSFDCVNFVTLGTLNATTYGTIPNVAPSILNLDQIGLLSSVQSLNSTGTAVITATFPLAYTITRLKYY